MGRWHDFYHLPDIVRVMKLWMHVFARQHKKKMSNSIRNMGWQRKRQKDH